MLKTSTNHTGFNSNFKKSTSPPTNIIIQLVDLRSLYNLNGSIADAMHIKDLLYGRGIIISDKLRRWYCTKTDRSGIINGSLPKYSYKYIGNTKLYPIAKIEKLVFERMQCRFIHDWKNADKLREKLEKLNVTLNDKSQTWILKGTQIEGNMIPTYWQFS